MRKKDGRTVDREILEGIRINAVERVLNGDSPEVVIQEIGFSRTLIYQWLKRYEEGGLGNLMRRKATGRLTKLGDRDLLELYRVISRNGNDPLTRNMVGNLIKREFSVSLSGTSIALQLDKIGIGCKRTTNNINAVNELIVKQWVEEKYPLIRNGAKEQDANICFLGVSKRPTKFHTGHRVLAEELIREQSTQLTVSTVAAFKPNNACCFLARECSYNVNDNYGENELPIADFVKALIDMFKRKVLLVVENRLILAQSIVKSFAKNNPNKLELEILPGNFPQPQEDEHIWNYIRGYVG